MTKLQPNVMQVDGLDQNGGCSGAVGAQNVRKNLISRQSRLLRFGVKAGQTLVDPTAGGLLGVGDARDVVCPAKTCGLVLLAVGHHAESDTALLHPVDPGQQLLCGDLRGVGQHGIVEIQHQKVDSPLPQKLGRHVCQLVKNQLWQQGKGHETNTAFIK